MALDPHSARLAAFLTDGYPDLGGEVRDAGEARRVRAGQPRPRSTVLAAGAVRDRDPPVGPRRDLITHPDPDDPRPAVTLPGRCPPAIRSRPRSHMRSNSKPSRPKPCRENGFYRYWIQPAHHRASTRLTGKRPCVARAGERGTTFRRWRCRGRTRPSSPGEAARRASAARPTGDPSDLSPAPIVDIVTDVKYDKSTFDSPLREQTHGRSQVPF